MSEETLGSRISGLEEEVRAGFRRTSIQLAEVRDELRRHFDIVAESLESRFQAVAEALISSGDRSAATDRRLTSIEQRVDSHDLRISALENRRRS